MILKLLILGILLFLLLAASIFSPSQAVDVWMPWGMLEGWPLGAVLFLFTCFGMVSMILVSLLDRSGLAAKLKQMEKEKKAKGLDESF